MYPSSNKKWKFYAPNLTVQLLRYWDKFYFASAGRARARAKYSFCHNPQDRSQLTTIAELLGMGLPAASIGPIHKKIHPHIKE